MILPNRNTIYMSYYFCHLHTQNLFVPIAPLIWRFNKVNGKTWVLYFLAYPTHGLSHALTRINNSR